MRILPRGYPISREAYDAKIRELESKLVSRRKAEQLFIRMRRICTAELPGMKAAVEEASAQWSSTKTALDELRSDLEQLRAQARRSAARELTHCGWTLACEGMWARRM